MATEHRGLLHALVNAQRELLGAPAGVRAAVGVLVHWLRDADRALAELGDAELAKWFQVARPGSVGPIGDVLAALTIAGGSGVLADASSDIRGAAHEIVQWAKTATPAAELARVADAWTMSAPRKDSALDEIADIAKRIQGSRQTLSVEEAYDKALRTPSGRAAYKVYREAMSR